jgi:Vacuolar sorting protein 9 (VPS9) domain
MNPLDKLKAIYQSTQIAQKIISLTLVKENTGADEALPSMMYVFLKSSPQQVVSNIK